MMSDVKPISVEKGPALKGKKILVRVDFDVPLDNNLGIIDDFKIKASLPTIKYLIQCEAKVILASHLGSPVGVIDRCSLKHVFPRLVKLIGLGVSVGMADDCVGDKVKNMVDALPNSGVLLLENLKFHAEEMMNRFIFAKELASLADFYVNDTFRFPGYSSTNAISRILRPYMAGFHRQKVFPLLPGTKKIHPEVADFTDLPPDADEIPEDYIFDGNLDCSLLTSTFSDEVLKRQSCRLICCRFPVHDGEGSGTYDLYSDASLRGEESSKGPRAGLGGVGKDHLGFCVSQLEGCSSRLRDIKFHETEALSEGMEMMSELGGVQKLRANIDSKELYHELQEILYGQGFSPQEKALLSNSEAAEARKEDAEAPNEDAGLSFKVVGKKNVRQADLRLKLKAKIVKLRNANWPGNRFHLRLVCREGNYSADQASRRHQSIGVVKSRVQPGHWPSNNPFLRRDWRTTKHRNERYLKFSGSYSFLLRKQQLMAKAATKWC